ncbi:DinB family protein [Virgibacillus halodenitrificans]|uniref:DinB family protein n=1 Tax=Virgibacillus halodenitrificans TaxID=1482 RepID=A0ABR7VLC3_VIRHA|nr:DinB family protein [Virgibacillus halodenitrificans]MBD1222065.1 DinB family protein [Virgibacillus halodenitrificans]MCG1028823.1 DinB family protein [Virgibacillus halodenitrificans]MCJ0930573.1 DinB family protein [Virgibacillus halodenitrificans]MYL46440.1 DinB family protein [Virgibacillus halodenitrificans]CDQ32583.1 DinB superfamily protein [Virgibacillus halodenitrificans]
MTEKQLFAQMKLWRNWTIEFLRSIPEEFADQIPIGHNNSIRWNAGHILIGWDNTMLPAVDMKRQMPLSYHLMFPSGSSPEGWTDQPPSMDQLIKQLEDQPIHIENVCKGHIEDDLKEPFLGMRTLGDMVVFHMNHESLHMGIIKSMKQSLLND